MRCWRWLRAVVYLPLAADAAHAKEHLDAINQHGATVREASVVRRHPAVEIDEAPCHLLSLLPVAHAASLSRALQHRSIREDHDGTVRFESRLSAVRAAVTGPVAPTSSRLHLDDHRQRRPERVVIDRTFRTGQSNAQSSIESRRHTLYYPRRCEEPRTNQT